MATKTPASADTVECTVLRGRIMLDGKIYKKGDIVTLPADAVNIHPDGMIVKK